MINEYKQTAVDVAGLLTALHNNSFILHEFILTDEEILITLKFIILFIQLLICLFIHSFIYMFLNDDSSFKHCQIPVKLMRHGRESV